MEDNDTNEIFTIVCVSVAPIITLVILFNVLVVCLSKRQTIDVVTCSLLLARLGHTCAVVTLMAVYSLKHWTWTKAVCQSFVWLWVTFWTMDLFTSLVFLLYNSLRIGHTTDNNRCHVTFLALLSCGLSVLAGAFTFMTDWMFNNLTEGLDGSGPQGCIVGLSNGEQPIRVAALFVIIIGGLLIIVLTITISAESRAQSLKYKLLHPEVISATNRKISIRDYRGAADVDIEVDRAVGNNVGTIHRDSREVYQIVEMTTDEGSTVANHNNHTSNSTTTTSSPSPTPTAPTTPSPAPATPTSTIPAPPPAPPLPASMLFTNTTATSTKSSNGAVPVSNNSETNYTNNNNHGNSNNNSNNVGDDDNTAIADGRTSNDNIRTWRYIDNKMRDIRHIHGAATSCTVLLNLLPQLILYSIDHSSGTVAFAYSHHILVSMGLLHAIVLSVTFCTAGLRYRASADRILKGVLVKPHTIQAQDKGGQRSSAEEPKLVFHIRDVTLTDSTADPPNDVTDGPTAGVAAAGVYTRSALTVPSTRTSGSYSETSPATATAGSGESFRVRGDGAETRSTDSISVQEEPVRITTVAIVSSARPPGDDKDELLAVDAEGERNHGGGSPSDGSSLRGTVNPGYVDHEGEGTAVVESSPRGQSNSYSRYMRSQSDGVVDYNDGDDDEEWGSWDSDSETWSNLYDESDFDDPTYSGIDSLGRASLSSPRVGPRGRRRSSQYDVIDLPPGHRRRRSSQASLPADASPAALAERDRRKSIYDSRKRKRRHRRRGSRDLVGDLAPMLQLGIASAVVTKSQGNSEVQRNDSQGSGSYVNAEVVQRNKNNGRASNLGDADAMTASALINTSHATQPESGGYMVVKDHNNGVSEQTFDNAAPTEATVPVHTKRVVSFGSELAAAANRFRRSYDEQQQASETNKKPPSSTKGILKRRSTNRGTDSRGGSEPAAVIPPAPPLPAYLAAASLQEQHAANNSQGVNPNYTVVSVPQATNTNLTHAQQSQGIVSHVPPLSPQSPSADTNASVNHNAPVTPQGLHPMLADMTLSKIMTNPFLTDMLRQSLESLESLDQDSKDTAAEPKSSHNIPNGTTGDSENHDSHLASSTKDSQTVGSPAAGVFLEMLQIRSQSAPGENSDPTSVSSPEPPPAVPPVREDGPPMSPRRTNNSAEPQASSAGVAGGVAKRTSTKEPRRKVTYVNDTPPPASYIKRPSLYEIPTIDSDHRYRSRAPMKRGIYAFRAAARGVMVSEFLKKSNNVLQSTELARNNDDDDNDSKSGSFRVASDMHYV